jgi:hypothetical protein
VTGLGRPASPIRPALEAPMEHSAPTEAVSVGFLGSSVVRGLRGSCPAVLGGWVCFQVRLCSLVLAVVGAGSIPAGALVCRVSGFDCLGKRLSERTGVLCDNKGRWLALWIAHEHVAAVSITMTSTVSGQGTPGRGMLRGMPRGFRSSSPVLLTGPAPGSPRPGRPCRLSVTALFGCPAHELPTYRCIRGSPPGCRCCCRQCAGPAPLGGGVHRGRGRLPRSRSVFRVWAPPGTGRAAVSLRSVV